MTAGGWPGHPPPLTQARARVACRLRAGVARALVHSARCAQGDARTLAAVLLLPLLAMTAFATPASFRIDAAAPADCDDLVALIRGLAEYESLTHLLQVTPLALAEHLFGATPSAEAVIARDADGSALGFALWFRNFSTFLGKPGLYLEDIFVLPSARGRGIGKALIRHVGAIAVERGCGRFEWSVLDWNTSAIGFYESLGATVLPDWRIVRVTGEALARFRREG